MPQPLSKRRIVAVRSYTSGIREKMFAILEGIGLRPRPEDILSPDLSDEEILPVFCTLRPETLLCPFHAMKTSSGNITHGLALLQKLTRADRHLSSVPVLMPISRLSAAAFETLLHVPDPELGPLPGDLMERILILPEASLDDPQPVITRIREHLNRHGVHTAGCADWRQPSPARASDTVDGSRGS